LGLCSGYFSNPSLHINVSRGRRFSADCERSEKGERGERSLREREDAGEVEEEAHEEAEEEAPKDEAEI
ncbi:hypothetical protein ACMD2_00678, partial [Ananas comosus]